MRTGNLIDQPTWLRADATLGSVGESSGRLPEPAEPLWQAICQRWLHTGNRRTLSPEGSVQATEAS